jgi:hypothetical protein
MRQSSAVKQHKDFVVARRDMGVGMTFLKKEINSLEIGFSCDTLACKAPKKFKILFVIPNL